MLILLYFQCFFHLFIQFLPLSQHGMSCAVVVADFSFHAHFLYIRNGSDVSIGLLVITEWFFCHIFFENNVLSFSMSLSLTYWHFWRESQGFWNLSLRSTFFLFSSLQLLIIHHFTIFFFIHSFRFLLFTFEQCKIPFQHDKYYVEIYQWHNIKHKYHLICMKQLNISLLLMFEVVYIGVEKCSIKM